MSLVLIFINFSPFSPTQLAGFIAVIVVASRPYDYIIFSFLLVMEDGSALLLCRAKKIAFTVWKIGGIQLCKYEAASTVGCRCPDFCHLFPIWKLGYTHVYERTHVTFFVRPRTKGVISLQKCTYLFSLNDFRVRVRRSSGMWISNTYINVFFWGIHPFVMNIFWVTTRMVTINH